MFNVEQNATLFVLQSQENPLTAANIQAEHLSFGALLADKIIQAEPASRYGSWLVILPALLQTYPLHAQTVVKNVLSSSWSPNTSLHSDEYESSHLFICISFSLIHSAAVKQF
jgi:hypothetical protein